MSYTENDEELRRIHEAAELRKKELEELQREELRRIQELEQHSGSGSPVGETYNKYYDSAFLPEEGQQIQNPLQNQQTQYQQNQQIQNPYPKQAPQYQQQIQNPYPQQQYQQAPQYQQQVQNPYPQQQYQQAPQYQQQPQAQYQAAPQYQQVQNQRYEYDDYDDDDYDDYDDYEERKPRRHTYDPDQMVSEEDYINSFEEDGRKKKNKKRPPEKRQRREEPERGRMTSPEPPKKKKKKKSPIRRFFRFVILLLLLFGLIAGLAIHNVTKKFNHIDTEVSERRESMHHSTINILLIGQDAREGESGQRADSIILLSFNKKTHTSCMTSIMRDTYVAIPGYGSNRINAAYAYGGVDLLDQTIEENFDVTIDGNMMVDFDSFIEAMTAVGDLEIELTAEEAQYMNENPALGSSTDESDEVWNLTEGVNSLTPSQVLCYSRIRYVGNSDWDRTERQRTVINAAIQKVKSGHLISGYKMASEVAPNITTDLKTGGMISIAFNAMTSGDMASHLIPVEGTYYSDTIDGMAVLVPDLAQNQDYLQKYIDGEE